MSWSLGEVGALTRKAARGAGLDWGAADELAWAVRWLCRCGLPGAESAAVLLGGDAGASALDAGLRLSDTGVAPGDLTLEDVRAPLILVPFLARGLGAGQGIALSAGTMTVHLGRTMAACKGDIPRIARICVVAAPEPRPAASPVHRVPAIGADALRALEMLAHRTCAPASEQSRLSGAGAGLSDNE